ncbi:pentatricopeptide repeat-containing protein [Pyrus ussuriensis x Pyrus communis]|uniref:Pentatricopeptide repeat-containing protein n=1 Tax=Pyrus ussuriensis x Pyrus communis TaxID=2448454 RepID=A0A5N5GW04_9ROSA|nr:pentatricopeptide repeat-containing protein [Pyrus ussuriensis x Pyrus communis]
MLELNAQLKQLVNTSNVGEARQMLDQMLQRDMISWTNMTSGYIGKIKKGYRLFDEMPIRNVVSCISVITGLVRAGYNVEGLVYFSDMWRSKVRYDAYVFAILLKACADLGALKYGRAIHTQTMKNGFDEISICLKKMRIRDFVSWTSIITTYVWTGQEDRAIKAFIRMQEAGVSPNEYTFAGVISTVANLVRLSVGNSIVTMYAKCGRFALGSKLFHKMSRRDIVSWSTLIAGYSQGGYGEEAFQFLLWIRRDGPKPNELALASVLSVCGSMSMLEQGKQLHAHVLSVGLEFTSMVQSALVNMYSKCGSIKEAAKIFDVTELSDIISWTAMINGYAEHGVGLKPDSATFIGVLVACCHAGLVDLGFHYYNSMSNDFGINHAKEHHGCMGDLLCRAGRAVDCGRRAADEILKLDSSSAATHITLANIGRSKEIKVEDRPSAFVAGDRSHPQADDIYSVLELLASKAEDTIRQIGSSLIDVEG